MTNFKKGDKFKVKQDVDYDYWYESGEVYTFDHYLSAEHTQEGCRGIVTEELIAEGKIKDDVWIGEEDVEPCQNELQDVLPSGDTEVPDIIGNGHKELADALDAAGEMFKELMFEVELADAVIRIFDLAGAYNYDLGGAVVEKMEYNKVRADHSKEARSQANGKRY